MDPVPTEDTSVSSITSASAKGKLLIAAKLLIWDDVMHGKHVFNTVDDCMRLIHNLDVPMAGKVFVFLGNFRQCLPVIKRGSEGSKILECITYSKFWACVSTLHLTINERVRQRVIAVGSDSDAAKQAQSYAQFLLAVGEGRMPHPDIKDAPEDLIRDRRHNLIKKHILSSIGKHSGADYANECNAISLWKDIEIINTNFEI